MEGNAQESPATLMEMFDLPGFAKAKQVWATKVAKVLGMGHGGTWGDERPSEPQGDHIPNRGEVWRLSPRTAGGREKPGDVTAAGLGDQGGEGTGDVTRVNMGRRGERPREPQGDNILNPGEVWGLKGIAIIPRNLIIRAREEKRCCRWTDAAGKGGTGLVVKDPTGRQR